MCVISAEMRPQFVRNLIRPIRSAVYNRKRMAMGSVINDPQRTNCYRPLRYKINHLCAMSLTPYDT